MAITDVRPARAWSPWLVGAGIGVVAWIVFLTVNSPLGLTRAVEDIAARFVQFFAPGVAIERHYTFREMLPDWEWAFLIGIPLGALVAVFYSHDRFPGSIPEIWRRRFGDGRALRFASAFGGAALMAYGARMAGDCTTGHGLGGMMQLGIASLIFLAVAIPAAALTARLMYGREA